MFKRSRLKATMALLASGMTTFAQNDPINNFCRRWGHQTALVDGKVYIDGGFVNYGGSVIADTPNVTNTYLLYSDLNDPREKQMPPMFDNLTRDNNVPVVAGGALYADSINRYLYTYGGEYTQGEPATYEVWQYDIVQDEWNNIQSGTNSISGRASWGGNAIAEDLGVGYWLGGWFDNMTTPGWNAPPKMNPGFITYDFLGQQWQNSSGPSDDTAYAEGSMNWIPAGDGGMLVYFGGVQQSIDVTNGSNQSLSMDQIFIYDIRNDDWFTQTATGDIPPPRRRFCAGASWAEDQSSYNIYLYGGLPVGEGVGYGDVYILSLPSFTWTEFYAGGNDGSQHHSLSCNILPGNAQMLIIGGAFPNASNTDCDVAEVYGQHNLDLGANNIFNTPWYQYLQNMTEPVIPSNLTEVIGGNPTGSATVTSPSDGWGSNTILQSYIERKYTTSARSPTRSIPGTPAATTSASTGGSGSGTSNTAAIAGGVVGGVVGLILIVAIVWLCLRARKKRKAAEAATASPHFSKESPNTGSPLIQRERSPGPYHGGVFHEHIGSPQDGRNNAPWAKAPGMQEMSATNTPSVSSPPPQFGSWSPHPPPSTNWAPVMAPHTPPQGQYGFPPPQQPPHQQDQGLGLHQTHSHPQQYFPPPPNPRQYADPETRHELGAGSPTGEHVEGRHEKDANGSAEQLPQEASRDEKS